MIAGSFFPAKQILPNVWIGSVKDASDANFIKKHDIRLIINATANEPIRYTRDVNTYRVPIDDSPSDADKLTRYLPITSLLINDMVRYNKNVLVHCYAGMNRSATVVAAYLMFSRGWPASKAMAYIKQRKPETFTPMNFCPALKAWEARLRAAGKIRQ